MKMITKDEINYIQNSVDIVDVVSSYIPLNKKGKNFFGVCPFHDDTNPSLSVSKEKQIYTCFSCGATGNVFNFIMDYEHINFYEALKIVSDISGVKVDISELKINKKNNELYELYETVQKFYQNNINTKKGILAKTYLKERDIDEQIIKDFGIGLSLNDNTMLYNLLNKKNYLEEDILKSGLINKNDHKFNDVFYNRIMFPIHDVSGKIVGYSGRIYNNEDTSKYINTKASPIFKKGQLLYNYFKAKEECRIKKSIIILEGFMDVIKLYVNNIKNTVATMGTAFTKEQAILIKKIAKDVIICFDGDEAGAKATLACSNELLKVGIIPKIVRLEDNLDPDDYINIKGINKFIQKLENPINIMDFKISYFKGNRNLKDNVEMAKYINLVIDELSKIDDEILRELTIKKISEESHIDENIFRNKLTNIPNNNFKIELNEKIDKTNKYNLAEQYLIYYMLKSEEVIKLYKRKVKYLPTYEYRMLALEISNFYDIDKKFNIADFFSNINNNEKIIKLVGNTLKLNLKEEYTIDEINDYINLIDEFNKKDKYCKLKEKLKDEIDLEEKIKIAEQIRRLKMEE